MKVITLLNEKGGVGKTTIATHIAAGMAARKYRVGLIDTDAQGHAGLALGVPKSPALYNLLVRDAFWQDVMVGVDHDKYAIEPLPNPLVQIYRLWVVASNVETRGIPLMLSDEWQLDDRIQQLKIAVDLVVIDTAPTPSLLHSVIYRATDGIIFPTLCESLSFDGLMSSLKRRDASALDRAKVGLSEIDLVGIVPTMYRGGTSEHSENLKQLCERYGDAVWEPIPLRTIWAEASTARLPVWKFAPNSEAAGDAWGLVDRVEKYLRS